MLRFAFTGIAVLVLSLARVAPAVADEGIEAIQQLLNKLSDAVRLTNYRGVYTYEHSGKMDMLEVCHAVLDGQELEKISFLNGPERVLVKTGPGASCKSFGGRLLGGDTLKTASGGLANLSRYYKFHLLGDDRVGGRAVWDIHFQPLDEHRHGLVLALDQSSSLPLRMLLVAQGRQILERVHLVSLDTQVQFAADEFATEDGSSAMSEDCNARKLGGALRWSPAWLPPGFVLSASDKSEEDGQVTTYTDGLSAFSVFVKPLAAEGPGSGGGEEAEAFAAKRGATVAVSSILTTGAGPASAHFQVTVVGEIPVETAKKVRGSVRAVEM